MNKIIEFIDRRYFEDNVIPSVSEIAAFLNMDKGNVSRYIADMKEKGLLSGGEGWRNVRTKRMEKAFDSLKHVPIVGEIACGTPILAEQNIDGYMTFSSSFLGEGEFFALKAKGDSMVNAGIDSGDLVIIRKQNTASDGQLVAALVDDSATLKRLFVDKARKRFILHPENENYGDMTFDSLLIQGVVKKIIKNCND